jgi:hypothetical protein
MQKYDKPQDCKVMCINSIAFVFHLICLTASYKIQRVLPNGICMFGHFSFKRLNYKSNNHSIFFLEFHMKILYI